LNKGAVLELIMVGMDIYSIIRKKVATTAANTIDYREVNVFELSQEAMNRMIHRLIDNAKDAIEDVNNNKNDEFYEGKKAAYYEMLDSLKNDLKIEDADIKEFGLDIDLDAMITD